MNRLPSTVRRRRGFTLLEMIVVIVITGIIAGIVAIFIRLPVQGYIDATARADLADLADTAARRFTRDVRLALPNSVRISADRHYLELLLTKTGGRYLAEEDGPGLGNVLAFDPATVNSFPNVFTIVGTPPSNANGLAQAIAPNDFIVVYNLGPGFDPADAYNCVGATPACNRARVAAVNGNQVTLADNPFLRQDPPMSSPSRRFQVVTTPVTYVCDPASGTLTRYSGYAIQPVQPAAAAAAPLSTAPSAALLARQVIGCTFSFDTLPNVQRGLVGVQLDLGAANSNTGTIRLVQQVQVNNSP